MSTDAQVEAADIDRRELRMLALLAWTGWPDNEKSRSVAAGDEQRDPVSAASWDRVVDAIIRALRPAETAGAKAGSGCALCDEGWPIAFKDGYRFHPQGMAGSASCTASEPAEASSEDRLRGALSQALRQWKMYAEMAEHNDGFDLATEKSLEGDMYRHAREALGK